LRKEREKEEGGWRDGEIKKKLTNLRGEKKTES
jgi:hypothetical protein